MFFIVPFQHDRMSVRRLPWVCITILAVNLLVFLALYPAARRHQQQVEENLQEVYDYWGGNPFVETTREFEELFPKPVSNLRKLIGSTWEKPPPDEMERQQREFESLMERAVAAVGGGPYGKWGYIPAEPSLITLLTNIFVHAGWLHLLGNMLFLYLTGPFIEDLWGRLFFPVFYLAGGVAAALAHGLMFPDSTLPLVGASGAIAAVMGTFMVRRATTRIQFLYGVIFLSVRWGTFHSPAWVMLPLWLFYQWWLAALSGGGPGVAYWAHIGGFLFGAAVGGAMKVSKIEERFIRPAIDEKTSYGGDARLNRGIELKETGEADEALKLFAEVARERPESLEARELAYTTALGLEDGSPAVEHAAPLLELCLKKGRPELALMHFETMAPLEDLKLTPRLLFALAGAQEKAGRTAEARAACRRLADENPGDLLALKALVREGELALKSGDRAGAAGAFQRARDHSLATVEWQTRIDDLEVRQSG